jgi:hypothetical protein
VAFAETASGVMTKTLAMKARAAAMRMEFAPSSISTQFGSVATP